MGTPATCHSQLCVYGLVAHANKWTAACMYKIYYTTIEGIEGPGLYIQCKLDVHTRVHIPYITVGLHGYCYNIIITILYLM